MFLIVGLGNPGKKYEKTRHNVGFMVVDKLKLLDIKKVVLVKPQTFMNDSGKAVRALTKSYTLDPKNLIIIHDDIDLLIGKIRISKNRGAGGHKGVESIIKELKTKNFIRLRIGIKPKPYTLNPKTLDKFVLQKFNKKEKEIIEKVIEKSIEAIEMMLGQGLEKTMNKYNKN